MHNTCNVKIKTFHIAQMAKSPQISRKNSSITDTFHISHCMLDYAFVPNEATEKVKLDA